MFVQEIRPVDQRRSRIVFDTEEGFVLYNGELQRFGIEAGRELNEEIYRLEILPKLRKRIRERIVFILKSRDKTEKELSDKLSLAGYPKEVVDYGVSWAKQHNFINDIRYLEIFVDSESRKSGERKLRYDLKRKGFSEEDIEEVLERTTIDEEAQISELLKKKGYVPKECSRKEAQKILASIVRKGYSYSKVLRCMHMEDAADYEEWRNGEDSD